MQRHTHRPVRVRDNVFWMLFGNVFYMACQWGVLIATVKLGTPAMVGEFSFAFAVCAPVFLLAQLRLRAASATDAKLKFSANDYMALRLLGMAGAMVCIGMLCAAGRFGKASTSVILIVALAKTIESGSDVLYGISQQGERMRCIAVSMILRGTLSLAAFSLLLFTTHRLLPALLGFCAGWAAVLLFYDLPVTISAAETNMLFLLRVHFDWASLKRLTAATLPLGLAAMLMSFALNMPRYFVQHYRGPADLGIFSALSYLTLTGAVVVNSISEAALPRFAKHVAERDRTAAKALFLRLMLVTAVFSVAGVAIAAAFSHPLLTLVYKSEYAGSAMLLVLLMVGAAPANLASVCNYLLLAGRQTIPHLISLFSLAAFMGACCWVAIPRWGTIGAAYAGMVAFTIQLVWACAFVWKSLRSPRTQAQVERRTSGSVAAAS